MNRVCTPVEGHRSERERERERDKERERERKREGEREITRFVISYFYEE
jgi:hypothetical protein